MQSGTFTLDDGRGPFTLRNPEEVIRRSKRLKVDMVVDRDHELVNAPKGTHIRAAGWVKEIQSREDGLWARVEWTDSAIWQIRSKEYRYISPVFTTTESGGGDVTRILHISLVNDPAMELTSVANRNYQTRNLNNEEETEMKFLATLALLHGLQKDASEDDVLEAAKAARAEFDEQKKEIKSIRDALGLDDKADQDAVLEAASRKIKKGEEVDPKEHVPMEMYQELCSRFEKLNSSISEDKAEAAVTTAMKEGKIAPAQKEWALSFASKDLSGFGEFLKNQPVVIAAGEEEKTGKTPKTGAEITAAQRDVCNQLGLSEDRFLGKTKKEGDE